jgi:large-conductance mechanosensitive channel
MDMNRIVGFLILALIVFFIITDPESAAHVVRSVAHEFRDAAKSVTVFFREVA